MKQNKPAEHSYTISLQKGIRKYGKEISIPRFVKRQLDVNNGGSKPNRYERYHIDEDMYPFDLLMTDEFIDVLNDGEYGDKLTRAYDYLRQICSYNFDEFLEGEHQSRFQQEYHLD